MQTQVAIIGGGPAGTSAALFLARHGIESVIIEKQTFPRYHIGESMSGECGAIVRQLGLEAEMNALCYPQKKGVIVYGPEGESNSWFIPVMQRLDDGSLREQSTWHVRRESFDKLLMDTARARGATVITGQAIKALVADDGAVTGVQVRLEDGEVVDVSAEVTLDCSGQTTFLANQGIAGPKYVGNYDKQVAFFSQVRDAVRGDGSSRREDPDNTLIFYKAKFHWSWFIPLDDEVVSVGVVCPSSTFQESGLSKHDFMVRELQSLNPELRRRIPDVALIDEVHAIPNYSFQVRNFTGKGYICVGDSHRFVDPIFSFGLFVAMREGQMAADAVADYLAGKNRDAANPFAEYQLQIEKGIDVLEDMVDLFWEQPFAFAFMAHKRYIGEIVDIFAGRVYDGQPSAATQAFRELLGRERESAYSDASIYSIPIGSRYHPERAPLWAPTAPLKTTEAWMVGD